jgi:hypothetical protein
MPHTLTRKKKKFRLRSQNTDKDRNNAGLEKFPSSLSARISRPLALGLRTIFDIPGMPVKSNHRNAAAQGLGSREAQRGFTPIVAKRLKRKTSTWRMAHGVGNIWMSCTYALTFSSRVCHLDIFDAPFLFCFHPSLLAFSLGISHTRLPDLGCHSFSRVTMMWSKVLGLALLPVAANAFASTDTPSDVVCIPCTVVQLFHPEY